MGGIGNALEIGDEGDADCRGLSGCARVLLKPDENISDTFLTKHDSMRRQFSLVFDSCKYLGSSGTVSNYQAGVLFFEYLPILGIGVCLAGTAWLLAANCWRIGEWERAAVWTVVALILESMIATLPAMELKLQEKQQESAGSIQQGTTYKSC